MAVVMISRWSAGLLSASVYNNYINAYKIPLLDWFPWFDVLKYRAAQVMNSPPRCFTTIVQVSTVIKVDHL